jgi:hypothetical protein
LFQRPLTIAGGVPQGKKPTALFQMTLNEFKSAAGVDTLHTVKGAKGSSYCWTSQGLLIVAKDFNPKSKVQTVSQTGFTDDGYMKFQLTNKVEGAL